MSARERLARAMYIGEYRPGLWGLVPVSHDPLEDVPHTFRAGFLAKAELVLSDPTLEADLEDAPKLRQDVKRLTAGLTDLLWFAEWMQREDRWSADLGETAEEADMRWQLLQTFNGDYVKLEAWLRALLAEGSPEDES